MPKLTYNYTELDKNEERVSVPVNGIKFMCGADGDGISCNEHGVLDLTHINETYIIATQKDDNIVELRAKLVTEDIDNAGYFTWTSHNIAPNGLNYSLKINLRVAANTAVETITVDKISPTDFCYNEPLQVEVNWSWFKDGAPQSVANYPDVISWIEFDDITVYGTQNTRLKNLITFDLDQYWDNINGAEPKKCKLVLHIKDATGAIVPYEYNFELNVWYWTEGMVLITPV